MGLRNYLMGMMACVQTLIIAGTIAFFTWPASLQSGALSANSRDPWVPRRVREGLKLLVDLGHFTVSLFDIGYRLALGWTCKMLLPVLLGRFVMRVGAHTLWLQIPPAISAYHLDRNSIVIGIASHLIGTFIAFFVATASLRVLEVLQARHAESTVLYNKYTLAYFVFSYAVLSSLTDIPGLDGPMISARETAGNTTTADQPSPNPTTSGATGGGQDLVTPLLAAEEVANLFQQQALGGEEDIIPAPDRPAEAALPRQIRRRPRVPSVSTPFLAAHDHDGPPSLLAMARLVQAYFTTANWAELFEAIIFYGLLLTAMSALALYLSGLMVSFVAPWLLPLRLIPTALTVQAARRPWTSMLLEFIIFVSNLISGVSPGDEMISASRWIYRGIMMFGGILVYAKTAFTWRSAPKMRSLTSVAVWTLKISGFSTCLRSAYVTIPGCTPGQFTTTSSSSPWRLYQREFFSHLSRLRLSPLSSSSRSFRADSLTSGWQHADSGSAPSTRNTMTCETVHCVLNAHMHHNTIPNSDSSTIGPIRIQQTNKRTMFVRRSTRLFDMPRAWHVHEIALVITKDIERLYIAGDRFYGVDFRRKNGKIGQYRLQGVARSDFVMAGVFVASITTLDEHGIEDSNSTKTDVMFQVYMPSCEVPNTDLSNVRFAGSRVFVVSQNVTLCRDFVFRPARQLTATSSPSANTSKHSLASSSRGTSSDRSADSSALAVAASSTIDSLNKHYPLSLTSSVSRASQLPVSVRSLPPRAMDKELGGRAFSLPCRARGFFMTMDGDPSPTHHIGDQSPRFQGRFGTTGDEPQYTFRYVVASAPACIQEATTSLWSVMVTETDRACPALVAIIMFGAIVVACTFSIALPIEVGRQAISVGAYLLSGNSSQMTFWRALTDPTAIDFISQPQLQTLAELAKQDSSLDSTIQSLPRDILNLGIPTARIPDLTTYAAGLMVMTAAAWTVSSLLSYRSSYLAWWTFSAPWLVIIQRGLRLLAFAIGLIIIFVGMPIATGCWIDLALIRPDVSDLDLRVYRFVQWSLIGLAPFWLWVTSLYGTGFSVWVHPLFFLGGTGSDVGPLQEIGYTVVMEPTAALRAVMSQGRKVKLLYLGILLPLFHDYFEPLIVPLALHLCYRFTIGPGGAVWSMMSHPVLYYCVSRGFYGLIKMELVGWSEIYQKMWSDRYILRQVLCNIGEED